MSCTECGSSGWYVGLNTREPCEACNLKTYTIFYRGTAKNGTSGGDWLKCPVTVEARNEAHAVQLILDTPRSKDSRNHSVEIEGEGTEESPARYIAIYPDEKFPFQEVYAKS